LKNDKVVTRIGWFASLMAIMMFASYIDQIMLNLSGKKGSLILPLATIINCISWICYALLKEKKDWPVFLCNCIGTIVAVITAVTGFAA